MKTYRSSFVGLLELSLILSNDLDQMRHKLSQYRGKFLSHNLGKVGKDGVGKFVQVRRIKRKSIACASHGFLEIGAEVLLTNGDGHVAHAFEGTATEAVQFFLIQRH